MEKNEEYYEKLDKRTNEYKEWKKEQSKISFDISQTLTLTDTNVTDTLTIGKTYNQLSGEFITSGTITQEELEEKHEKVSKGLGDTVAKAMKYTGIKQVIEAFTPEGKDCGCDKRKEELNKLFKYKMPLCLNVQEYEILKELIPRCIKDNQVSQVDQPILLKIYNRVFQVAKPATSCNSCIPITFKEMQKVYETYK